MWSRSPPSRNSLRVCKSNRSLCTKSPVLSCSHLHSVGRMVSKISRAKAGYKRIRCADAVNFHISSVVICHHHSSPLLVFWRVVDRSVAVHFRVLLTLVLRACNLCSVMDCVSLFSLWNGFWRPPIIHAVGDSISQLKGGWVGRSRLKIPGIAVITCVLVLTQIK